MEQKIVWVSAPYDELTELFKNGSYKRIFLVCDNSIHFLKFDSYFADLEKNGFEVFRFDDFKPNPDYKSVVEGVKAFRKSNSELIIAIGGGSAMDVAKCIKIYADLDPDTDTPFFKREYAANNIPFWAVPTTSGTGSEATRYAVIYYNDEKQSITDESFIPSMVFMDVSVLFTLPEYQKKSTMLDALCHAVEAFWSVNSTEESRKYSSDAIRMILNNVDGYLANTEDGNRGMLMAAHTAGKAINITQTTAGHAMCYKLTSLYGIAHGHAAALCLTGVFPYTVHNTEKCIDPRGEAHLKNVLNELADAFGCESPVLAAEKFRLFVEKLELRKPVSKEEDLVLLTKSVNPVRLKNYPVALNETVINKLYREILGL